MAEISVSGILTENDNVSTSERRFVPLFLYEDKEDVDTSLHSEWEYQTLAFFFSESV